jgi:hypothetical protein
MSNGVQVAGLAVRAQGQIPREGEARFVIVEAVQDLEIASNDPILSSHSRGKAFSSNS